MAAQNTSGPWSAEGPDCFGDYNIHCPAERAVVAAVISNVRPDVEVAANARLIALSRTARVTFRVRQCTALTFAVLREMAGLDVVPVEEEALFGPFQGEQAANDFAYGAAERFHQHYPSFQVDVQPFPKLGRRTGQAYAEFPPERDPPPRLTKDDCLPKVCSPW